MMIKKFSFFLLILSLTTAFYSAKLSPKHSGTVVVVAKVIEQKFVNKGGKEMGYSELYLKVKQHTYFIKWSESKVTSSEIEPYVNKKVKLKIKIKEGLWDTDNPEVQSRIGEYAIILKLLDKKD